MMLFINRAGHLVD